MGLHLRRLLSYCWTWLTICNVWILAAFRDRISQWKWRWPQLIRWRWLERLCPIQDLHTVAILLFVSHSQVILLPLCLHPRQCLHRPWACWGLRRPTRKIVSHQRTHRVAHWAAAVAAHHSGNSIGWRRNSCDYDQKSTRFDVDQKICIINSVK